MEEIEIRPATADERTRGLDCLRCGFLAYARGPLSLRTGGVSGGWSVLFGGWADIDEGTLSLHVYACPSCGHVEFRLPDRD
jgi:predicted RNA-binding Zn-ribbon protein involved in translation (DUF1610 family)